MFGEPRRASTDRSAPPRRLRVGGALDPTRDIYIVRQQDEDLYALLSRGEFCNVLTSRQMGKSSAMRYASMRLRDAGVELAEVDFAGNLGTNLDLDQWYCGLLSQVSRELGVDVDVDQWWDDRRRRASNQRLQAFFREVLVPAVNAPIVIFVDEIDAALRLGFTDDFFTAIRAMYNQRAREPAYGEVTFCLLGVAEPDEFIRHRRTTPYNIGSSVELRDFQLGVDDLSPFVELLEGERGAGQEMLEAIMAWTGGHPFLTASLCHKCIEDERCRSPGDVARVIEASYGDVLVARRANHFASITRLVNGRGGLAPLALYERIRAGAEVADDIDKAKAQLKLSGLVKRNERGNLVVRNRIYERVFDLAWARAMRRRKTNRAPWLAAFAAAAVIGAAGAIWYWYDAAVVEPARSAVTQAQTSSRTYFKTGRVDEALIAAAYASKRGGQAIPDELLTAYRDRGYGALVTTLRGHRGEVNAVVFTPAGDALITGSDDGTIRAWQPRDGRLLAAVTATRASDAVTSLSVTRRGDEVIVVAVTGGTAVSLWSLSGGVFEQKGRLDLARAGKGRDVGLIKHAALHPRREVIATAGERVITWAIAEDAPRLLASVEVPAFFAAYSPSGDQLVIAADSGVAEVRRGDLRGPALAGLDHDARVVMAAFDASGRAVVTASQDGRARRFELADGRVTAAPVEFGHGRPEFPRALSIVTAVSACGELVVTSVRDTDASVDRGEPQGYTAIWRAGGAFVRALPASAPVYDAELSPDCALVASAQEDGLVRVWRTDASEDGQDEPASRWSSWQRKLGLTVTEGGEVVPLGAAEPAPGGSR